MGKRLFIAIDIDEATREQIGRISIVLRRATEQRVTASWVRPDRMHLTLHFFASADAALEQRVRGALAQPIAEAPFDVSFHGLGFFPERGSPRVLWLGIRDGLAALRRVQRHLDHALGASPERHGVFTPHLTLARFRDRVSRARLAEMADIPATAGPSPIDRVTLYESRLSPAGPTYLRLAEALMAGSG